MTFDLTDKVALVTGSTQNLGRTIAGLFLKAGARVILHGPSQDEADKAADELRQEHRLDFEDIHAVGFDLGQPEAVEEAFAGLAEAGRMPDILVNNAAHLGLGESGFLEQSPEFFRRVIEVNLFGAFRCCQLAAAAMKRRGEGAIVNISSLAGERAIWRRSAYNTSKAALDGLTRSMAIELAGDGIRVNAIAPGYVWTPRWNDLTPEAAARRKASIPCGQPTRQEEIARTVLLLASDAAPTLTGSRLILDGGLGAQQLPPTAAD